MTFKEYRNQAGNNARFSLNIQEGKNLKKAIYSNNDFEDDEDYILDDYEVIRSDVNYGLGIHYLTIKSL